MATPGSEALYRDMQKAIHKKNYGQMRAIIANPDYNGDRVGGSDQRTALHTAAHEDDREALAILLGQTSIDTNVRTTRGLTPFLYAASKGKMISFEVLLNDSRVDIDERDGEDQSAMELINSLDKKIKALKAENEKLRKAVAAGHAKATPSKLAKAEASLERTCAHNEYLQEKVMQEGCRA